MPYFLITDLSTGKLIVYPDGRAALWDDANGPSSVADPRQMCCPCPEFCDGITRYDVPMSLHIWRTNELTGDEILIFEGDVVWPQVPNDTIGLTPQGYSGTMEILCGWDLECGDLAPSARAIRVILTDVRLIGDLIPYSGDVRIDNGVVTCVLIDGFPNAEGTGHLG